ncbi:MAG TPA: hypothetical protein VKA30_04455 [Actinomycetota bacterium]|nr:hypothetical protein [Actinomycetota bacterium]
MTTSEAVQERALALAESDTDTDTAVRDLLECCAQRRVSVVLARQHLAEAPSDASSERTDRAVELLDEVLERLPM